MPGLARDLSDLPSGGDDVGEPPDAVFDVMDPIAAVFAEMFVEDDDRPMSIEGRRVRGSWAAKCARAIGYGMLSAPKQPRSVASQWAMYLGRMVHTAVEEAMVKAFPNAEVEVTVDLEPDISGCGNIDAVIREEKFIDDGLTVAKGIYTTVFELKTRNGYGYKLNTSSFKGAPTGPSYAHKVQGALYAHGMKADRLVIGYISMEVMAAGIAEKSGLPELGRCMAQWSYTPEQFEPWAQREMKRMQKIIGMVDLAVASAGDERDYAPNLLPPRSIEDPEIPPRARIVEPMVKGKEDKGRWEEHDDAGRVLGSGLTWHCGYCDYRPVCIADGPS